MRTLQQACEDYCLDVVAACGGNKAEAARCLEVTRATLYKYLRAARERREREAQENGRAA